MTPEEFAAIEAFYQDTKEFNMAIVVQIVGHVGALLTEVRRLRAERNEMLAVLAEGIGRAHMERFDDLYNRGRLDTLEQVRQLLEAREE